MLGVCGCCVCICVLDNSTAIIVQHITVCWSVFYTQTCTFLHHTCTNTKMLSFCYLCVLARHSLYSFKSFPLPTVCHRAFSRLLNCTCTFSPCGNDNGNLFYFMIMFLSSFDIMLYKSLRHITPQISRSKCCRYHSVHFSSKSKTMCIN